MVSLVLCALLITKSVRGHMTGWAAEVSPLSDTLFLHRYLHICDFVFYTFTVLRPFSDS